MAHQKAGRTIAKDGAVRSLAYPGPTTRTSSSGNRVVRRGYSEATPLFRAGSRRRRCFESGELFTCHGKAVIGVCIAVCRSPLAQKLRIETVERSWRIEWPAA